MLLAGDPDIISEQFGASENSLIVTPLQMTVSNGLHSNLISRVKIFPVVPEASPKPKSLSVLASTQNENKVISTKKIIVNKLDTPDINQLELKNLRCSSTMVKSNDVGAQHEILTVTPFLEQNVSYIRPKRLSSE